MAWDANVKGNPAWLTKTASEHGGVDNFIDDIHNEGYQEGHEQGMIDGVGITVAAIAALYGAYEGIKYFVQKHKKKRQEIQEHAEVSESAIRQICDEAVDDISDEDFGIDCE